MTSSPLTLKIAPNGEILGLHDDALVAAIPGVVTITRATLIEPLADGRWGVWDARVGLQGDPLFVASSRGECLAWEVDWVGRTLIDPPSA